MNVQAANPPAWLPGGAAFVGENGRPVLIGGHCTDCNARMFPKSPVCPSCMSENIAEEELPSSGTLYSFTEVHVGPAQWRKPLTLGYVDLPNGVRVFAHLLPSTGLQIGGPVTLTTGEVGTTPEGSPINTFMFQAQE